MSTRELEKEIKRLRKTVTELQKQYRKIMLGQMVSRPSVEVHKELVKAMAELHDAEARQVFMHK